MRFGAHRTSSSHCQPITSQEEDALSDFGKAVYHWLALLLSNIAYLINMQWIHGFGQIEKDFGFALSLSLKTDVSLSLHDNSNIMCCFWDSMMPCVFRPKRGLLCFRYRPNTNDTLHIQAAWWMGSSMYLHFKMTVLLLDNRLFRVVH